MKLKTEIADPEVPTGPPPTHDQRIKDLLMDALELEPAQRASFVASLDDDPSVRSAVLALIAAHERAGEFMSDPTSGLEAGSASGRHAPDESGSIIERYRLMSLIGEGGFGSVYLAEQREPVVRQVALKIIKLGMDTRQVIARFEAERQALALMDHPGIARVLDAGADSRGRPYFVMELVQGVPITAYCDQHRLDLEQRLDLFSQVCAAVQHAHMKGIIHRDLKPSNILVADDVADPADGLELDCPRSASAQPKVIDFGIAKAISGRLTDKTLVTEFRQLIGTPEYMSPEQAEPNASDIDTRTDVYSLGVVLYELLTGSTPLNVERVRSASFAELQRMIREDEPEKPSTRLSSLDASADIATRRAIEPNRLASQLRGDLDWITLKAMEKDRQRRYGSPAELAEDLRRNLAHEPVSAGPQGWTYRARKFMRRHRVGVGATSLVAAIAAIGAVLVAASMLQARDAADQTSQINQFMTNMLTSVDPDRGKGADVRLVEVLGEASSSASQWFAGHPELEAQVREVLGQAYSKLSLFPQCVSEFQRSVTLSEAAFGPDDPLTLRRRSGYASALGNAGRRREAQVALDGLPEAIERALGREHDLWFVVQNTRGVVLSEQGQRDQAVEALQDVLLHAKAAGAAEPVQIGVLRGLGQAMWRQLENAHGPERKQIGDRLVPLARELAERSTRYFGSDAVLALDDEMTLAQALFETGEFQAAAVMCRGLLGSSAQRLGECHTVRKTARSVLSLALLRLGAADKAADLRLRDVECDRLEAPIVLVAGLTDALPVLDRGGRWAEGERLARELAQRLEDMGGGHGPMVLDAEVSIARFVSLQDRTDEADRLFQSLLAREAEIPTTSHVLARLNMFYGAHLARQGLYAEAEQRMQRAAGVVGEIRRGTWNAVPDDLIVEFIALYRAWDKPEKVAEYERLQYEALHPLEWTPSVGH